jgi:prevent-host-death family protein
MNPQPHASSAPISTASIAEARASLGPFVRWTARTGERLVITDRGRPVAVLVNVEELADLDRVASQPARARAATNLRTPLPSEAGRIPADRHHSMGQDTPAGYHQP